MTLANYSELQADLADWLNRDDLVAAIPTFIRLAETEMVGQIIHWKMEARAPLELNDRYVALPDGFESVVRIELTGGLHGQLDFMPSDAMAEARAGAQNPTGQPQFYSLTAGELELFPTPGGTYTAELVYRGSLTPLSDAAPVNWLLTERPAAYLYGALKQSAPYLKDDMRTAIWAGLYGEAIEGLKTASEAAKHGGTLRIRQR
jgi:hypothetical protein